MLQQSAHNHLALMLEEDLDSSSDEEDLHPRNISTILDALDQMEVDNDPEAGNTENDKLDEIDKQKRGTIASHNPAPGPVTKEVSYIITVFSAAEMKKAKTKCEPISASVNLNSDEPWDTLKAQVLVKISNVIKPRILNFNNYALTYQIPRVLPKPGLSLITQADFDGMMKRVNGMNAVTPLVNITVVQGQVQKANTGNDENEDNTEHVPTKNKKRKESSTLLPGNKKKLNNIQILRAHWNNPVLQRRLDTQNTKSSSLSAPVFNFTIRNEVINFFRPQVPVIPAIPLAVAPAPSNPTCTLLLHPSCMQGTDMPLNEFCAEYDLGNTIHVKFVQNAYKEAQFLHFITIPELKEMGFRMGEIAALCDAVERWSLPRA
ncbi:hypothetical protein EV702DRAFT_1204726 [Suillus placidus]|uniref:Uncharacterized protein n=1 Tax=Suillus placidus TaxID=48579 RepID=A0A9P6ZGW7_9AGAM|nr:hypothetical protein EV702DRAFT_1204726 [Suillus placidus]